MKTNKPKLLLVDGMALLFRAFYATAVSGQYMYNKKGIPTNAVNGLLKHMFTALQYFRPTHLAVCWDLGNKTFRNELYNDYKGNRTAPPEEIIPQFDLAKTSISAFSIPNIAAVGYEADDCLGTVAHKVKNEADVIILTGDRDIFQVLDDGIKVALMKKGYGNYEIVTKELFIEMMGYTPRQFIDFKGLTGDASDHYPGVRGIGPKTAEKLIKEFGTVENILASLDQIKPSIRKKIEEDQESLLLSKKLAEIQLNVPLTFSLEDAKISFFEKDMSEHIARVEIQGMDRLLRMIEDWKKEVV